MTSSTPSLYPLSFELARVRNTTTIRLRGPLDTKSAGVVRSRLAMAICGSGSSIMVDAEGIHDVGDAGVRTFLLAQQLADELGVEFSVVATSDDFRRALAVRHLSSETGRLCEVAS